MELYEDWIASSLRFIIHPLEGLPTHDPEVLFKLMLEGRVTDVAALKHFTLTD